MKNSKLKLSSHLCLLLFVLCSLPVTGNDGIAPHPTVRNLLKEIINQDFKDWNEIMRSSSMIDFKGSKIALDGYGNQYLEGKLEISNETVPRNTRVCTVKFIGKQNEKINRVIISHDYKRDVASPLIDFIMTNVSFEERLPVRTIFHNEVEKFIMGSAYIEGMPDLGFSMSKHHPLRDADDLISYIAFNVK